MKLVIISGQAGSGKSIALNTFEDHGYYCIDNLPIGLIHSFTDYICKNDHPSYEKIAIGIDVRNLYEELQSFPEILEKFKQSGINYKVFFLKADENILIKRFSETRRKHPLTEPNTTLSEAIRKEVDFLEPIIVNADLIINTSKTNVHQLRNLISEHIGKHAINELSITFQSFGFKYSIPTEADFVFDTRCLPNPYWDASLRSQTGLDADVIQFMAKQDSISDMIYDIIKFMERWIPVFQKENRQYLTIAIGCTGGQHRSVYIAQYLSGYFLKQYENVSIKHRELEA